MKKSIRNIITACMAALMTIGFTSCEDEIIADTLQGTWEGNMYVTHAWNNRVYQSVYSEIEFLLDPFHYTSGSGYWVDYYSNAPWDYIANHIDWRVSDEVITIYFREEGSRLYIRNYSLNDNRFVGEIYDGDNYVRFSLYHTSSPNWDNYYWGTDYWYDDWYDDWWTKRTMMDFGEETDSLTQSPTSSDAAHADTAPHTLARPVRGIAAR